MNDFFYTIFAPSISRIDINLTLIKFIMILELKCVILEHLWVLWLRCRIAFTFFNVDPGVLNKFQQFPLIINLSDFDF